MCEPPRTLREQTDRERKDLIERIRSRCLSVAEEAYEYAGIKGLCAEGRWALALDAIRSANLDEDGAEPGPEPGEEVSA